VKGLLAIFFSVALILSQAAASINGPLNLSKQKASTPECCSHRSCCNGEGCCVADNNSDSRQPAPAVPSHTTSQYDLQMLTSASVLVWQQSQTESAIAPASFLVRSSVAAPLYQRNCSYLI